MLPLVIITGIFLGSSVAITISLGVVVFLFYLMVDEYPHLQHEFLPLIKSTGLFLIMTICSALGFLGLLKKTAWRWWAQMTMWATLAGIVLYYWPDN